MDAWLVEKTFDADLKPKTLPNQSHLNESPSLELSIVMPCLNEADSLDACIEKAQKFVHAHKIGGEVIVADNGSTDGSQDIVMRKDD